MRKKELIQKLQQRLSGELRNRSEPSLLGFLIEYLERLHISHEERFDFWQIDHYLPQIVADAIDVLRTSEEDWVLHHREAFEKDVRRPVPNVINTGDGPGTDRVLLSQTLQYIFSEAMGDDWIRWSMDSYLNAESYVLQQNFDKFLRLVFRKGLYDLIQNDSLRSMDGKFGKTELRTFVMAGRVMFTFAQPKDDGEISVSFVAEDDDPEAYSAGCQSVYASLVESIGMIEDVITNWPDDPEEQTKVFNSNEDVTLDVIAATRGA